MWHKLRPASNIMSDNFRVAVAAVFGAGSPVVNWVLYFGPLLDSLLTVGQIAVAVATTLYIVRKWRALKSKKK